MEKNGFTKRNLGNIPKEEKWELVHAIIRIAYIIYNSGLIVAEKLEMPNEIEFHIRELSSRASGFANPEKFISRNLDEISADEKKNLSEAIKKIAKITNNNFATVVKKLEMPDRFWN